MREIRELLSDTAYTVLSMKEAGLSPEIVEDGTTFTENALIKARTVHRAAAEKGLSALVLADDSGLEVDAMNKEPGVYSSRWMGEDTSYEIKNRAIIERLEGLPEEERTARFVSAVAAVFPDGAEETVLGTVEGRIAHAPAGSGGFGYDPIFYVPELGVTSAELSLEEKNRISHRGKALRAIREKIRAREEEA